MRILSEPRKDYFCFEAMKKKKENKMTNPGYIEYIEYTEIRLCTELELISNSSCSFCTLMFDPILKHFFFLFDKNVGLVVAW